MSANADRFLVRALKAEGEARGIGVEVRSGGWIVTLTRGDARHHVFGYQFGLNPASASLLAGDKAGAYQVLKAAGVPAVEHRLFLRPDLAGYVGAEGNWAALLAYAEAHGGSLVAKPNDGTGGAGVTHVRSQLELEAAAHILFRDHRAMALGPFLKIRREVRLVVLDGESRLAYAKRRASGAWKHNLGLGARPEPLGDASLQASLQGLAARAMAVLGLRFASVDVVEAEGAWQILEVNAGVMMETYALQGPDHAARAQAVYGAALDALFPAGP